MRVSKEFKTGLVVVISLGVLFVGVNFLKGYRIFSSAFEFHAIYKDVDGLVASNPVLMNGLKVGQVKSVQLDPRNPDMVVVTFIVDYPDLMVPKSSEAELISSDLLGSKALKLNLGTALSESDFAKNGDTLFSSKEESLQESINKQVAPLKRKTEELISSVENIIVSVNAFWDTSAANVINESLYDVRAAIDNFGNLANQLNYLVADERARLGRIFGNIESISSNLKESNDRLTEIFTNVESITDSLSQTNYKTTIDEANNTLANVNGLLEKINNGEGTIGALVTDDSLYYELVKTNREVQDLVWDLRQHPNRYLHISVFGRKDKGVKLSPSEERKLKDLLEN